MYKETKTIYEIENEAAVLSEYAGIKPALEYLQDHFTNDEINKAIDFTSFVFKYQAINDFETYINKNCNEFDSVEKTQKVLKKFSDLKYSNKIMFRKYNNLDYEPITNREFNLIIHALDLIK